VDLEELLAEYDLAREHTLALYADLPEADVRWRPSPDSSGIGWHLGHQAAVNHYMLRNLVAAESTLDGRFDDLFDSATEERQRGELPPLGRIVDFRETVAARTHDRVEQILRGRVGAPRQMVRIAGGLLVALVHHEYQHDAWIGEMREALGRPAGPAPRSGNVCQVDGYWVLDQA
jgi:hypothetical protein